MTDRRSHDYRLRSLGRSDRPARARVRSASYAAEQLIAELRQLGQELVEEPVPQHLVDILRNPRRSQCRERRSRRARRAS